MAEIKIERKKGVPVWALLLALVLLIVLVWAALAMRNNHRQAPQNTAVLQWTVRVVPAASIALTEPTGVLARCA